MNHLGLSPAYDLICDNYHVIPIVEVTPNVFYHSPTNTQKLLHFILVNMISNKQIFLSMYEENKFYYYQINKQKKKFTHLLNAVITAVKYAK